MLGLLSLEVLAKCVSTILVGRLLTSISSCGDLLEWAVHKKVEWSWGEEGGSFMSNWLGSAKHAGKKRARQSLASSSSSEEEDDGQVSHPSILSSTSQ